jgi:solute carrier family 45 protein 1/2/4
LQLGILIQKGLEAQGPGEATRPLSSTSARDVEEDDPLMQRSNSATEQGEDEDYGAEAGRGCTAERRASRSKGSEPRQSGAIAGLHNVSIVLPQFFMTAFSSIVFQLLESKKGAAGQYSTGAANIGLVLRLGGLSAFLSSYYALRLARQHSSILEG